MCGCSANFLFAGKPRLVEAALEVVLGPFERNKAGRFVKSGCGAMRRV